MNKDNAHLYLPLVQALADGKVIQYNDSEEGWMNRPCLLFDDEPDRYRIKPEPREWWHVVDLDGCVHRAFKSKKPAVEYVAGDEHKFSIVHVREVIE